MIFMLIMIVMTFIIFMMIIKMKIKNVSIIFNIKFIEIDKIYLTLFFLNFYLEKKYLLINFLNFKYLFNFIS